jgi:DNA adenine methylase
MCSAQFPLLRRLILQTPQSRAEHRRAEFILKNAEHCDDMSVAWAFWVQTQMSFSNKIFAGYGYAKTKNSMIIRTNNKKKISQCR